MTGLNLTWSFLRWRIFDDFWVSLVLGFSLRGSKVVIERDRFRARRSPTLDNCILVCESGIEGFKIEPSCLIC